LIETPIIKDEFFQNMSKPCVHISQIKNERVNAVADVVDRGQKFKVKVGKLIYYVDFLYNCFIQLGFKN